MTINDNFIYLGHVKVVEFLISHGANADLRIWSGKSPLDIAKEEGESNN